MSTKFIEALGSSNASKAYTYFAANTVPDQTAALKDGTHWNGYGGYELAKAMATETKRQNLTFAKYLSDDYVAFDPSVPDAYASFALPFSPFLGAYEVPDSAVSGRMASFRLRARENRIEGVSFRSGALAVRYTGPQEGLELCVVDLDGSLVASRMIQGEEGVLRAQLLDRSAHRVHLVELIRDGIVLDQRRVLP